MKQHRVTLQENMWEDREEEAEIWNKRLKMNKKLFYENKGNTQEDL